MSQVPQIPQPWTSHRMVSLEPNEIPLSDILGAAINESSTNGWKRSDRGRRRFRGRLRRQQVHNKLSILIAKCADIQIVPCTSCSSSAGVALDRSALLTLTGVAATAWSVRLSSPSCPFCLSSGSALDSSPPTIVSFYFRVMEGIFA